MCYLAELGLQRVSPPRTHFDITHNMLDISANHRTGIVCALQPALFICKSFTSTFCNSRSHYRAAGFQMADFWHVCRICVSLNEVLKGGVIEGVARS